MFLSYRTEKLLHPPGLDGLKTLSIDSWRSVVGLRRLIRRSESLHFTHMNVETPKPPRLLGFRLTVYPSPQFLQINGRFYHASPASPRGRRNQTQHGPFAPETLLSFFDREVRQGRHDKTFH